MAKKAIIEISLVEESSEKTNDEIANEMKRDFRNGQIRRRSYLFRQLLWQVTGSFQKSNFSKPPRYFLS